MYDFGCILWLQYHILTLLAVNDNFSPWFSEKPNHQPACFLLWVAELCIGFARAVSRSTILSCRCWDTGVGRSKLTVWRGETSGIRIRLGWNGYFNILLASKYRVLLNDGQALTSLCLLSARLNHVVEHLATFSIIKISDYFMTDFGCKKILVILELEVLTSGQLVGEKLGNPAWMGSDGKIDLSVSTARAEWELGLEPDQRPGQDDDLQEAMDQLSDLQI